MWRYEASEETMLPDVRQFLTLLAAEEQFFTDQAPLFVARAPGRLDVMGGIADYSGSLVLELPLAAATLVAVQQTAEPMITVKSSIASEPDHIAQVRWSLHELFPDGKALNYSSAQRLLTADPQDAWSAYCIGTLLLLQQAYALPIHQGMHIFIHCTIPVGKGVGSSAALEVATMQGLGALFGLTLSGRELALLCQQVENLVVGAPCGVMDQMTVACGMQDHLLALLCQPAELQKAIALPDDIELYGIDSGIRHAVSGSDYGTVRVGAFMGYRIIAELAGLNVKAHTAQQVTIDDPYWGGYLANIEPAQWENVYRDALPLEISGATFLEHYGGSTDSVTRIDPQKRYAVRQPTAHPIYEHQRVRLFRTVLEQTPLSEERLTLLGELMYQSHTSYSTCGIGSAGTDRLVELVQQAGTEAGLYGAKITGGGSGGTIAVLTRRGSQDQLKRIVEQYEQEIGHRVALLRGSSAGAVAWGTLQLHRDTTATTT